MKKENIFYLLIGLIVAILIAFLLTRGLNIIPANTTGQAVGGYGNSPYYFDKCIKGCDSTYPNAEPDDTEANACREGCYNLPDSPRYGDSSPYHDQNGYYILDPAGDKKYLPKDPEPEPIIVIPPENPNPIETPILGMLSSFFEAIEDFFSNFFS